MSSSGRNVPSFGKEKSMRTWADMQNALCVMQPGNVVTVVDPEV